MEREPEPEAEPTEDLATRVAALGIEPDAEPEPATGAMLQQVAEAPWSVAEWAVAHRFDNPRATVPVLLLG